VLYRGIPHSGETIKGKSLQQYKNYEKRRKESKLWDEAMLESDLN
jgi:hypothetical protein